MLRDEKSSVNTWEDLQDLNRKVIELGEQWNKPVCATCDVHFLDPEDEVYRRIIMAGKDLRMRMTRRRFTFGRQRRC